MRKTGSRESRERREASATSPTSIAVKTFSMRFGSRRNQRPAHQKIRSSTTVTPMIETIRIGHMIGPPLRKLSIRKFPLIALAFSAVGEAAGEALAAAGEVSVAPTVDPGAGGAPAGAPGEIPGAAGATPGAAGATPGAAGRAPGCCGTCPAGLAGAAFAGAPGAPGAAAVAAGGGGGGVCGFCPNAVNAMTEQMQIVSNVFIVAADSQLPARFPVTVSSFIPKGFVSSPAKLFTFY